MNFGREKGNAKDKIVNGVFNPAVLEDKGIGKLKFFVNGFTPTSSNSTSLATAKAPVRSGKDVAKGLAIIPSNFIPHALAPNGLYYANNTFVAIGQGNLDTGPWTTTARAIDETSLFCFTLKYDNGIFMAAGSSGRLSTSTNDGLTWVTRTSQFGTSTISTVAYANGTWVAVGAGGTLRTSTDNGVTWNTQTSNFGTTLINSVAFGNGVWIAVGNAGTLRTSTNATTWVTQTSQFGTTAICAIAYGNGTWVAAGGADFSNGHLRTSTDNGVTWNTQTITFGSNQVRAVAYANGTWLIAGGGGQVRTSTDAITWTSRTFGSASGIWSLNYSNGLWFAGGDSGALRTSVNNGVSWFTQTSNFGNQIYGIAGKDNLVLLTGQGSSGRGEVRSADVRFTGSLSVSTDDGITWSERTFNYSTYFLRGVAYGNNVWIAGGGDGHMVSSTDLISWSTRTSNANFGTTIITAIAYGNGTWVAAGAGGTLRTSTNDGVTWNTQTSQFGVSDIFTVAYDNGVWVAGGTGGIRTSTNNGVTWNTQTSNVPSTFSIFSVAYGNGVWVAGGSLGTLRTSTDNGVTWNTQTSPAIDAAIAFQSIAYGNGYWVAGFGLGINYAVISSDAITWSTIPSTSLAQPRCVAFGNNRFLVNGGLLDTRFQYNLPVSPTRNDYGRTI